MTNTSRIRTTLRRLAVVATAAAALLGVTATSAWALNHNTYNKLKSADVRQYCTDMKSEDPAEGARAQLWTCSGASQQQFILVVASGPVPGLETIRSKSARKCLTVTGTTAGSGVVQHECYSGPVPNPTGSFTHAENWDLRTTGEIVNQLTGMCLDTTSNRKGAPLMVWPCNGNISQRWYF
ncbi:hypothetical protein GCM10009557_09730 [Virgisporangium ochraceum]|uniref:Ricin B lectin domain-containing protein n=1 Tax=Virgisporangium ochraceum TaxID=65505 RepID=A0A8J4A004_9ACTN|nr:RICIN domain-containing protein [Virgisporangium ochraceum]GIJ71378.1 hypothetical protein Voc01_062950 [Virgisporangium ochraceum]